MNRAYGLRVERERLRAAKKAMAWNIAHAVASSVASGVAVLCATTESVCLPAVLAVCAVGLAYDSGFKAADKAREVRRITADIRDMEAGR